MESKLDSLRGERGHLHKSHGLSNLDLAGRAESAIVGRCRAIASETSHDTRIEIDESSG